VQEQVCAVWKFPVAVASLAITNESKSVVITQSAISSGVSEANLSISILTNRGVAYRHLVPLAVNKLSEAVYYVARVVFKFAEVLTSIVILTVFYLFTVM
jgi:hypothetical protein